MENPFKELREGLGLSRSQMALALNSTYNDVSKMENGGNVNIPRKMLPCLLEMGIDSTELQRNLHRWRAHHGAQLRKMV